MVWGPEENSEYQDSPTVRKRAQHIFLTQEGTMVILYHTPTEWERFMARIGRLNLQDISNLISSHKTRELYGMTEGTISLVFPNT